MDNLKSWNWCVTTALFPGGLCGRRGMAALEESRRLAPVQEHLHGLVRDCAHLRPDQCRHHGHLHPWHPVSNTGATPQGTGKERTLREGKEWNPKAKIYRLPQANNFGRRRKSVWVNWDMGLWFLAALLSPQNLRFVPVGPLYFQWEAFFSFFFISHNSVRRSS